MTAPLPAAAASAAGTVPRCCCVYTRRCDGAGWYVCAACSAGTCPCPVRHAGVLACPGCPACGERGAFVLFLGRGAVSG